MKLTFVKVNPLENMTIFVLNKLARDKHESITNQLMSYNSLHGDQVGFIEEPKTIKGKSLDTLRLQMMGGIFSASGAGSLAAYMVYNNHPSVYKLSDQTYRVSLEESGSQDLLKIIIRETNKSNVFYSRLAMPVPERISTINIDKIKTSRVDFEEISYFIVDSNEVQDKEAFYKHIKRYLANEDYKALGIIFYDQKEEFIEPLVYSKMSNRKFWPRSCGSGAGALAIVKAQEIGDSLKLRVKQAGGVLEVNVNLEEGKVKDIFLDGRVEIVAEGIVNIEE